MARARCLLSPEMTPEAMQQAVFDVPLIIREYTRSKARQEGGRSWEHLRRYQTRTVYSWTARAVDDPTYFTRSINWMKSWTYDYSGHPLPWRSEFLQSILPKSRLIVGVFKTDRIVDSSAACKRALKWLRQLFVMPATRWLRLILHRHMRLSNLHLISYVAMAETSPLLFPQGRVQ